MPEENLKPSITQDLVSDRLEYDAQFSSCRNWLLVGKFKLAQNLKIMLLMGCVTNPQTSNIIFVGPVLD